VSKHPLTAFSKVDVRKRMRLVEKARIALSKLEPGEQALLFREFGRCACSEIAKLTKYPDVVVGAIVGGIVGAFRRNLLGT